MTDSDFQALLDTVPAPPGSDVRGERLAYAEGDTALDGYLAWDAAIAGPRPSVLVVHDWNGEDAYERTRAEMLARLGYVALAADLYGAGIRPAPADARETAGRYYRDPELLRARVRAGYDALRADPRVAADAIVVIGYCFGGTAAIEFARSGPDLRGTVSFHGGLIAHDPPEVSRITGSLLVLNGAADPVVPDAALVAFEDELRTRDDLDWQVVSYSGAPHAFTRPGTPNYRPVADARSWAALRLFLGEVVGTTTP